MKISKRGFDGIVKKWRRSLHEWDNVDKIQSNNTPQTVTSNIIEGENNSSKIDDLVDPMEMYDESEDVL